MANPLKLMYHRYTNFYSYVASVVEVSVENNKLKVHKVNIVVDCGAVVNTNTVKSKMCIILK
ncbi:molybdopterin-dependent oxidoreductase [Flavobacteriaceae bacterium AH-315-O20]|nr:molybdopterin-dependent oxidoreductase [Flavobacteriaceae bacterium AH-315-O20]